ncbi:MAG: hypothetical protein COB98_07285 [Flavobacteriaceae bacterium]|nr:MAG: hypothetical protein COB98_07285 [Flavobacteriaceae bacterium]
MPFIKDEELLEFHKAIDFNKNMAAQWKEKHDDTALKNEVLHGKKNWILIALITLGLFCLFLLYVARVKPFWLANNKTLEKSGYHMVNLNKNPNALEAFTHHKTALDSSRIRKYEGVMYQVQIGAFKNFSIAMHSEEFSDLTEYSNGFNKYALGKFSTYADATIFKNDLKRIGFKKAFLVSFYKEEQINIRKALELSGEPEFLEQ